MTTPYSPEPAPGAPEPAPRYAAVNEPGAVFAPAPVQPSATATTPAAPPKPARGSGGRWLNILLVVALGIAVGGVAFAVGRSTAPAAAASTSGFRNGGFVGGGTGPQGSFAPGGSFVPGQGGFRGGFLGAGSLTLTGTVTAVDATGVTIKTANGDEVTIATDGSTTYHTATAGSASDVTVGASVDVKVAAGGFGGPGNGNGNAGNGNGNGGNGGSAGGRTLTAGDVTVRD